MTTCSCLLALQLVRTAEQLYLQLFRLLYTLHSHQEATIIYTECIYYSNISQEFFRPLFLQFTLLHVHLLHMFPAICRLAFIIFLYCEIRSSLRISAMPPSNLRHRLFRRTHFAGPFVAGFFHLTHRE